MEKKLTNSGPLREPVDKHSIYKDYTQTVIKLGRTEKDAAFVYMKVMLMI